MYRDAAQTPAVISNTMNTSQSPSRGTVTPSMIVTGSRGRIASTRRSELSSNRRSINDVKTMTSPMLATTLASAGARYSGRNTSVVHEQSHESRRQQRQPEGPPDPDIVSEVIPVREARNGERIGPLAQVGVDVGRPGGHRPVAEVHQTGPLIGHHETEAERRDDGGGPGSEEDEEQVVSHRGVVWTTSQQIEGVECLVARDGLDGALADVRRRPGS